MCICMHNNILKAKQTQHYCFYLPTHTPAIDAICDITETEKLS